MKAILRFPTVAQMIAWLQTQPQDASFRIEDPDTMWTIGLIHARRDDDAVWLTGEYHEMSTDKVTW